MNIGIILNLLILAVLVFIATQLYIIARELTRNISLLLKNREIRKEEQAGQTINVNVTPVTNENPSIPSSINVVSENPGSETEEPEEIETALSESDLPDNKVEDIETQSTPSGPHSVKCQNCQAENSSYRKECFNCGKAI